MEDLKGKDSVEDVGKVNSNTEPRPVTSVMIGPQVVFSPELTAAYKRHHLSSVPSLQTRNQVQHQSIPDKEVSDSAVPAASTSGGSSEVLKVLSRVENMIAEALKSFEYPTSFMHSANERKTVLSAQVSRLQETLPILKKVDDVLYTKVCFCIARSYEELGDWVETRQYYQIVCPYLSPNAVDMSSLERALSGHLGPWHVAYILYYTNYLIKNENDLGQMEEILRSIPWLPAFAQNVITDEKRGGILYYTIRVLNCQERFEESLKYISIYRTLYESKRHELRCGFHREMGIATASEHQGQIPRRAFVLASLKSCIRTGLWHPDTLSALLSFGKTLREWNELVAAQRILSECCRGFYYRYGRYHPASIHARKELQKCKDSEANLQYLWRISDPKRDRTQMQSIAYKHIHLNTLIDVIGIGLVPGHDYAFIEDELDKLLDSNLPPHEDLSIRRLIARCKWERGGDTASISGLTEWTYRPSSTLQAFEKIWVRLDEILLVKRSGKKDTAVTLAKNLLFELGMIPIGITNTPRIEAVRQRLTTYDLVHFSNEMITKTPSLISEEDSESLGRGTYASVDRVKSGNRYYARKSVVLPRYHQQQVRDTIQNEISVIRRLNHPHTIRVYFTYESKTRFCIVMEPLADCDLEVYLEQHTKERPTFKEVAKIWKWFLCLSNTLAFIHAEGVRHKDIKPSNILVKNDKVIFADFGSSHAFVDEGNVTTEGMAYGHTKMYCAPEVIRQGRRNRSSDIFSLGCVFTELAVWLVDFPNYTIADWHNHREKVIDGVKSSAYHSSLREVANWFGPSHPAPLAKPLFKGFIENMIHEKRNDRATAVQTSDAIVKCYRKFYESDMVQCPECPLDLWIDSPGCPSLPLASSSNLASPKSVHMV